MQFLNRDIALIIVKYLDTSSALSLRSVCRIFNSDEVKIYIFKPIITKMFRSLVASYKQIKHYGNYFKKRDIDKFRDVREKNYTKIHFLMRTAFCFEKGKMFMTIQHGNWLKYFYKNMYNINILNVLKLINKKDFSLTLSNCRKLEARHKFWLQEYKESLDCEQHQLTNELCAGCRKPADWYCYKDSVLLSPKLCVTLGVKKGSYLYVGYPDYRF